MPVAHFQDGEEVANCCVMIGRSKTRILCFWVHSNGVGWFLFGMYSSSHTLRNETRYSFSSQEMLRATPGSRMSTKCELVICYRPLCRLSSIQACL